ncbi:MAG TPA: DinB family protein [Dehalococcoidia bacterium]|nr:DinB family protein [Dehalococcoidia bacterium]
MGERSEAIANDFEKAVAEFRETIQQVPESKWSAVAEAEGWTVAQLAEHVAGQFPLEMEFITAGAEGKDLPAYSWDDINNKNDTRAANNASATKEQVLSTLEQHAPNVTAYIRGLDDSQLDNKRPLGLANGAEVTTQQLLEGGVLIDHVRGHLASIRSAL